MVPAHHPRPLSPARLEDPLNRPPLARLTAAFAVASLATALILPLSALAAPPQGWSITSTNLSTEGVSNGSTAGFRVVVKNTGPSNISSLFLLAGANANATTLITDNTVYLEAHDAGGPVSCTASNGTLCAFGAVPPGREIDVTVAYKMPFTSGGSSIWFGLNTTGVVTGANSSHGDVISSLQTVAILPAELAGDAAGEWTTPSDNTLANAPVGGTNLQQTGLRGLASYIGTYVQDGSTVSFTCPKATCKSKPFGQWSKVSVAGGQPQGAPFQITITIAKSQLPSNLSLSNVVVYHTLDNNGGTDIIGDIAAERCDGGPTSANIGQGCIDPSLDAAGNLVIDVWVLRNGGFRGAS
jgi:hypothetical protein